MTKLSAAQIQRQLETVPAWKRRGSLIRRGYEFDGFPEAIRFVRRVAVAAEKAWHHPEIDIRWNKVRLTLTTHDQGALTEKDFALAREFDRLFAAARR